MKKPVALFVVGAQKAGTTSLYSYFLDHPDLSAPSRKEPHFFDNETLSWAEPNFAGLKAFFNPEDGFRLRFDATPIYGFWPPSMQRIQQYNPDAKLICLFRNPIERAWSHWCMEYARGGEKMLFADAIRAGRKRMDPLAPLTSAWRVFSYVERGFYTDQVKRMRAHFPADQLLFLRSNDLLQSHRETLQRISDFLGVCAFPSLEAKREHQRAAIAYPSELTLDDRKLLGDLFHDDLREFTELTGLDLDD